MPEVLNPCCSIVTRIKLRHCDLEDLLILLNLNMIQIEHECKAFLIMSEHVLPYSSYLCFKTITSQYIFSFHRGYVLFS